MQIDINIWAVLVATVFGMVSGALWYSPILFGKAWMEAIGKKEDELGSAIGPMVGSIFVCLTTAVALSVIISLTGANCWTDGLITGLLIGAVIVGGAFLSDSLFCGWPFKLFWIQAGYRALYIIVMSIIISVW